LVFFGLTSDRERSNQDLRASFFLRVLLVVSVKVRCVSVNKWKFLALFSLYGSRLHPFYNKWLHVGDVLNRIPCQGRDVFVVQF